jgi:C_GCAxxG_C_C family probable redox protein
MTERNDLLDGLRRKGYCCSQILVSVGLQLKGSQNEELVAAVKGLCGGLRSGLVCGSLSGGVCLLSLMRPETAGQRMIPELVSWFRERFGALDCTELLTLYPAAKLTQCAEIVDETAEKCLELLDERQYD